MKIADKLIKFDKYLLNLKGQVPFHVKKNIRLRLREIFEEELKETEIGKKWRKQFENEI